MSRFPWLRSINPRRMDDAGPAVRSTAGVSLAGFATTTDTMKLTIHKRGYNLVALNKSGKTVATRITNCNPAAIHQIILDAEMVGEIDWDNSSAVKPEAAR